jgi:hypothetical protein
MTRPSRMPARGYWASPPTSFVSTAARRGDAYLVCGLQPGLANQNLTRRRLSLRLSTKPPRAIGSLVLSLALTSANKKCWCSLPARVSPTRRSRGHWAFRLAPYGPGSLVAVATYGNSSRPAAK